MNCDCLDKIGERLKEKNLKLTGLAMVEVDDEAGLDFELTPYINTAWINKRNAPVGKKNSPPHMLVSHCPFCGVLIKRGQRLAHPEAQKKIENENTVESK